MSLNTWGMPHSLGSEDKELRMAAIGRYINQSEHDVYLLEELWMRPDHATIARKRSQIETLQKPNCPAPQPTARAPHFLLN